MEVKKCPTCKLRYEDRRGEHLVNDATKHACPRSVQPCGACGGQYGSRHVCLPPEAPPVGTEKI